MSATPAVDREFPEAPQKDRRRWVALAFIAVAQLMIALDATVVSIALPSAQAALHASDADRQWVVTAYTLAFGGLLLLGGRVADYLGRKRAFLIGLAGFSIASMLGGAAPDFAVLVAARALQGAFAALLAPTALSLLAVTFTQPRERATAFAVYGSIAGSGAAIGMLLGGALTQYLSWRWCLYVNLPIALIAAVGGWRVLARSESRPRPSFDLPGALLVTGALAALVYACTNVVTSGWSSPNVTGFLVASAVMLVLFVLRESSTSNPLLPLRILADRNRSGAYVTVGLGLAGMFGAFLFLTYYLQVVLRFPPLQAGLAFLPITLASQAGSWLIARQLMPRVAPRLLMVPAALVAMAGMALLTQLHVDSGYMSLVLPAEILLGLGISSLMVPAFSIATRGVDPREAGVASATVNTAQQVGASLGTALLNTVATSATAGFAGVRTVALVHGFSVATAWGAGILLLAAITAGILINSRPSRR
ncbi:MAG: MFS transporter [Chloroflexi bacterium]|nr:MAG: MFS transporter [Actinobacteria bacterium 13_2_20CM_2_66_6]TMD35368.1 MAG: MFS transporter [Chloroflexota bacterium]TMD73963.1 MAG: MFS transporter [Chloroflexota bacterium]